MLPTANHGLISGTREQAAPGRRRHLLGGAMLVSAAALAAWLLLGRPSVQPHGVGVPAAGVDCQASLNLVIHGAIEDCARPVEPFGSGHPVCTGPVGADSYSFNGRLRGTRHNYLLYVEIPGSYRGAQTYPLLNWPNPTLGTRDGVARVAVREIVGGALWRSIDGAVTIAPDGGSGEMKAILTGGADPLAPATQLSVAGHWQCG